MQNDPLRGELEDVIKRIENAAYTRGWYDALKHVVDVAESAHAAPASTPADKVAAPRAQRKAGYGAIGGAIESALDAFGDEGVAPADVVSHAREKLGEDILESSVRGRLNRMSKRHELRNARGRWFRARQSPDAAEPEAGDGESSPAGELPEWFGDRDAAA